MALVQSKNETTKKPDEESKSEEKKEAAARTVFFTPDKWRNLFLAASTEAIIWSTSEDGLLRNDEIATALGIDQLELSDPAEGLWSVIGDASLVYPTKEMQALYLPEIEVGTAETNEINGLFPNPAELFEQLIMHSEALQGAAKSMGVEAILVANSLRSMLKRSLSLRGMQDAIASLKDRLIEIINNPCHSRDDFLAVSGEFKAWLIAEDVAQKKIVLSTRRLEKHRDKWEREAGAVSDLFVGDAKIDLQQEGLVRLSSKLADLQLAYAGFDKRKTMSSWLAFVRLFEAYLSYADKLGKPVDSATAALRVKSSDVSSYLKAENELAVLKRVLRADVKEVRDEKKGADMPAVADLNPMKIYLQSECGDDRMRDKLIRALEHVTSGKGLLSEEMAGNALAFLKGQHARVAARDACLGAIMSEPVEEEAGITWEDWRVEVMAFQRQIDALFDGVESGPDKNPIIRALSKFKDDANAAVARFLTEKSADEIMRLVVEMREKYALLYEQAMDQVHCNLDRFIVAQLKSLPSVGEMACSTCTEVMRQAEAFKLSSAQSFCVEARKNRELRFPGEGSVILLVDTFILNLTNHAARFPGVKFTAALSAHMGNYSFTKTVLGILSGATIENAEIKLLKVYEYIERCGYLKSLSARPGFWELIFKNFRKPHFEKEAEVQYNAFVPCPAAAGPLTVDSRTGQPIFANRFSVPARVPAAVSASVVPPRREGARSAEAQPAVGAAAAAAFTRRA